MAGRRRLPSSFAVLAGVVAVLGTLLAPVRPVTAGPTTFHPLFPVRLVDTRATGDPLGEGEARAFTVAGTGGVPPGAPGVVLNITITQPSAGGYLTVWPDGAAAPATSSLNFVAGQTVANAVITGVGAGGRIRVANAVGTAHVVVDVTGWFSGGFRAVQPQRLLDTRGGRALGPGARLDLPVAGPASGGAVPAGAVAVAMNVTAVEPSAGGYLTVWPAGRTRPTASNVNMVAGQTVPNLVVSGVGADGSISVFNAAGSTDVLVDVLGWFEAGGGFTAVTPARVLDTRTGWCGMTLAPGESRSLAVAGHLGVPGAGAGGVLLTVTVVDSTDLGYVTVWPTGAPRPQTSSVNSVPGRAVPNLVAVGVGEGGQVTIANGPGRTEVIVDVTGWFDGATPGGDVAPCPGGPAVTSIDPVRSPVALDLEDFATLPPGAGRRMMKLTSADATGRTFLGVQEGQVWSITSGGTVGASPFLDLRSDVPAEGRFDTAPDDLLTYFAFHPDFADPARPGYRTLYTAHRERVRPGATFSMASLPDLPPDFTEATQYVLAEWTVRADDPERVDPASYRPLLRLEQRDASGIPHGIGELTFDPFATPGSPDRGLLHVVVGDGSSGNNRSFSPWAQRLDNPFGKILRIDPLADGAAPYRVPVDNPFAGGTGAAPLVWAYGLRNPQTLGWGRTGDGRTLLLAADIGQDAFDELDVIVRGGNHGWSSMEGLTRYDPSIPLDPTGPLVLPRVVLDREWASNAIGVPSPPTSGSMAIITTGAYRGTRAPQLADQVVFGDLVRGRFFHVPLEALASGQDLLTPLELPVRVGGAEQNFISLVNPGGRRSDTRFGTDGNGELYVLNKYDGVVRRASAPVG
jgi:hypothetical protein